MVKPYRCERHQLVTESAVMHKPLRYGGEGSIIMLRRIYEEV
jgi:hypothetical protein